jgi:uncharacterized membrane protein
MDPTWAGSGWWWVMVAGMSALATLAISLVVVLAWQLRRSPSTARTAEAILEERYARGEMTEREYLEQREVLTL